MKILLTEDDRTLSKVLNTGLKKIGYAVDCAYDGEQALEMWEINEYDLIILDLNLPKLDGYQVLKKIRDTDSKVKILILTARGDIDNKLKGFELGTDDYLTKPFDFMELQVRMNALIRRNYSTSPSTLNVSFFSLDTAAKKASISGNELNLTRKEYAILEYLCLHHDSVISADTLIEHVWNSEADSFSNAIKFHMSSLRSKIKDICGHDDLIETIRGQGYIIRDKKYEK